MSFEHNASPQWIESLYTLWSENPNSVPAQWRAFFHGFAVGEGIAEHPPHAALKQSAVQSLIYRHRDIGHLLACTDPLLPCALSHPLLDLEAFELSEADLDRTFHIRRFYKKSATLREILTVMRETYTRSVGVEFMHIQDPSERQWLIDRMEPVRGRGSFAREEKLRILYKLREAEVFESFLHRKFLGQKRFSLEGGEVMIPLLDRLVSQAAASGIGDLVLGMAHRGRLNVLATIFCKPLATIFAEFEDNVEFGFVGEGDVKYHRGFSTDVTLPGGGRIHLAMTSNPSHLEAVDPVVEGKCRARQDAYGAEGTARVLPVLIHGDAAFAGQGMVAEVLNLSQLEGYRTGGTVHIVLNNQIGFTTTPRDARSTLYATDVARMLAIPIFHVHGEDPEAVIFVTDLALKYRQAFGRDVVVEVICYRRHGHNEGDEPYFTQPLMYEKIKGRPTAHELYARQLRSEGFEEEVLEEQHRHIESWLEEGGSQRARNARISGFGGKWSGIERDWRPLEVDTAVDSERLKDLIASLTELPSEFTPHGKIFKQMERRRESVHSDDGIDWSTAESLAFASLLSEGTTVRLSGQDSRRGTFSQRHAVLFDIQTGESYCPFQKVAAEKTAFHIYDSLLSEQAVLGFEYGYSLETPHGLTIWEAQFGDFVNGAQVIIDQFMVSGQTKWDRVSGLTLLLPHGYEGQGPEHSSARIERFLQLCAGNNIQVAYPSTPAQFFHLLRRQVRQPFRRPLVIFTPKALLRHPRCVSTLAELTEGGFREVVAPQEGPDGIKTLLLCSGKVYYDLLEKNEAEGRGDVAIFRLEQLYPLRTDLLKEALAPYMKAERIAWVQEEPSNAGAWSFVRPHLRRILGRDPEYVGRDEAASPAVGSHRMHKVEQEAILGKAILNF
jgi:2-oxoglutarate dehydrogenase E1 component